MPYDTTSQPDVVRKLYYKGTLVNFVYRYYTDNKPYLQSIKSPAELSRQFKPGEKEFQQLQSFAKKDSINIDNIPASAKAFLLENFQSMLARQIWRTEGYYEVSNTSDAMIKKALVVMNGQ